MLASPSMMATRHKDRLAGWIRHHQLALFFVLTFLFSWGLDFLGAEIHWENQAALGRLVDIGAYGPALAALLLSEITRSGPRGRLTPRWLGFFIMALVLAAGSEWLDHIWWGHTIDPSLVLVDLILVMLAALTISWLLSNRRELISGFMGEISWRKRIPWILIVLGLWPLLVLASNTMAGRLGLPLSAGPVWPNKPLPLILTESLLWFALFGGPLNEEPGWRGFALPRLQGRFSPLVASIILGALWGLWHVPLHLMGVYGGGLWGSVIRLMDIPRAVLFTWVYNRTKGSLLIAILFHAAINTTSLFLPRSHHVVFVMCFVAAAIVVLTDRMWKKLPGSGLADESA